MASYSVDNDKLNAASNFCTLSAGKANEIANKIANVSSILDSRVASKIGGSISSLSSKITNVSTNCQSQSSNLSSVIQILIETDNTLANPHFSIFLQSFANYNNKDVRTYLFDAETLFDDIISLLSENSIPVPEELIDFLKNSPKKEKWLDPEISKGKWFHDCYNNEIDKETNKVKYNSKADSLISWAKGKNGQYVELFATILELMASNKLENSDNSSIKSTALVYGDTLVNNPLIHMHYYNNTGIEYTEGFKTLIETGKMDCIEFVEWSYFQALSLKYQNDPDTLTIIKGNMSKMDIGGEEFSGLIYPEFSGDKEGSLKVKGATEEELIAFLQPGNVIAYEANGNDGHVLLVKDLYTDESTGKTYVVTLESTGRHGVYEKATSLGSFVEWPNATIVQGEKVEAFLLTEHPDYEYDKLASDVDGTVESIVRLSDERIANHKKKYPEKYEGWVTLQTENENTESESFKMLKDKFQQPMQQATQQRSNGFYRPKDEEIEIVDFF